MIFLALQTTAVIYILRIRRSHLLFCLTDFGLLYARHYLTSVIPAKKRATLHLMTSLAIILTDRRIIAPYFVFSFRFVAIQQFNIADDLVIIAIPYTAFFQNKRS